MIDAVSTMADQKISELPVVDAEGRPAGLIDVTDVVSLFPEARWSEDAVLAAPEESEGRSPQCRIFHEPQDGQPT
jgi:CBS domain-containing protein